MPDERAAILVCVPDAPAREAVVRQLRRRYGGDYEVLHSADETDARERLDALRGAGRELALVIARASSGEAGGGAEGGGAKGGGPAGGGAKGGGPAGGGAKGGGPAGGGAEGGGAAGGGAAGGGAAGGGAAHPLFAWSRTLYPDVRRSVLIDWGSWARPETARTVSDLMARTLVDYYLVVPAREPDESFHRAVTDLLHDWERASGRARSGFTVIGDPAVARTHALRILLARGGVGADAVAPSSAQAQSLLAGTGTAYTGVPLVRVPDGRILRDPDDTALAAAYGLTTTLPGDPVDLVIVGAGPAGLAAAVYAASEGLRTLVLEAESIGGQAGSSSLIRNYLGFPRGTSGADLAQRAYQQAWAFGARFAHARRATGLRLDADGGFVVEVGGEALTGEADGAASGAGARGAGVAAGGAGARGAGGAAGGAGARGAGGAAGRAGAGGAGGAAGGAGARGAGGAAGGAGAGDADASAGADAGGEVRAGAVVLATGVSYRRLAVPGLEPFVGVSVFYGATSVEARAQEGKAVFVVGGGNSAGQAALHLSRYAASVSLVIRGTALAESMSQYLIDELAAAGVEIVANARVVGAEAAHPPAPPLLERIVLADALTEEQRAVPCEALFITIGARPHTSWLPPHILRDRWGSVITGHDVVTEGGRLAWPHVEPPAPLESSVAGFYAVGDVRRASVKRVASAVGEGSVVISSVHQHLGR
ncbi:FAD-dependent oxidoreductase [Herbiconiux sp. P16]|uniref:FAD-dependent oxidoreductase n=1 Tax=Herbiconiux wuyangfengii TaxID=3342794 RepID=UPI0035B82899